MAVNTFRCCRTFSTVLRPSNLFIPRAFWSTPRESSPFCLSTPAAVTLQAQFRFHFYSSTTAPSSLPTDAMNNKAQRAYPAEIKGQSGRRFKIERVLQDKVSLLDRIFLATAHCPPPGNLVGAQLGNWMWRSPEAHAEGPMNKPSDIFAFAIVCIYAVTKRVIFGVLKEELGEDEEVLSIVLERQLSYFGDPEAFNGFLHHLRNANPENPWIEIFEAVRSSFNVEYPREPFSLWQDETIDEDFKDLIVKMANFDPGKRITAREALEHKWFIDV